MVGNDVVDLDDPESQPEQLNPRFDTRVFTRAERARIAGAADPSRERWRLWAAKEAAYKLARKLAPTTVFSPVRFAVELLEAGRAEVVHGARRFLVRLGENDSAVHAVAVPEGTREENVISGWEKLPAAAARAGDPDAPSRAVRELLMRTLAPLLGAQPDELEVRRHRRVPQLWLRGAPAPVDLSLSHHGSWLAFACTLERAPLATAPAERAG